MHRTISLRDVLGLGLPVLLLAALSAGIGVKLGALPWPEFHDASLVPVTVTVPSHGFSFAAPGSYQQAGRVVDAPMIESAAGAPLIVMRNEVTVAQYRQCVSEGGCRPPELKSRAGRADFPITGVSYDDAEDFAHWLSRRTGLAWRLPSLAEWHGFAAIAPRDERAEAPDDGSNPALRWIATYERETALAASGPARLAPVGTGGDNQFGIADTTNAVWEWTASCVTRVTLDALGREQARLDACGAHYLEGRHRAEMSDFITDGVTGGCATGRPPDHLGFRLVRDPTI